MTDARARLLQALGQWSVEICRPDAELAPPQYLLDAIDAAAPAPSAPPREPLAWLVNDPINPSQLFAERPTDAEIGGGTLVPLYADAAPARPEEQQPEAPPADQDVAATLLRLADMNGAGTEVCRAAAARIRELEADARRLREALEASRIAIDDWLNTFAAEMCGADRVREAFERINRHGGTIAYIANIQERNRAAIAEERK